MIAVLVTLLIGSIGGWVAYQQMLIARQKLKQDLFDRRFAVYKAAHDMIVAALNRNGGTAEETRA